MVEFDEECMIFLGLGFGMIYLPAIVMVGYYFESKRAIAMGISVSGSGVGAFLLPPVSQALLKSLGWKGANLILAGFLLICTVSKHTLQFSRLVIITIVAIFLSLSFSLLHQIPPGC